MIAEGLRLALTTCTVLPLRPARADRATAGAAMGLVPLVGLALGALAALLLWGLAATGAPGVLVGALTVGALALGTRGMHLDGLADTVDGLGSYAGRERALEILRSPEVGPFGVATLVLVLLIQAAALGAVPPPAAGLAVAAGRVAVPWACRRGVPAARAEGLGAAVAGSLPGWVPLAWTAVLLGLAVAAAGWPGPVAVAVGLAAAALVQRHAVRRLGGVTGDVLGALVEVTTTGCLVVLALSLSA